MIKKKRIVRKKWNCCWQSKVIFHELGLKLNMKENQIQNKFSDETSMVCNTSLAAKGGLAHRLQRRTACKIQNGRQGAPK